MTTAPVTLVTPLLFDRSDRLLMEFTGPKAAESLTGLVTNDVLSLRGGDGQYACALTNKGRIIADVRILAVLGEDGAVARLLVNTNAASGVGFAAMIRKYVNPRTAKYADLSQAMTTLTLAGEGASALLSSLAAEPERVQPVIAGQRYTHRDVVMGAGLPVRVVRLPDLGDVPAFDLLLAAEHAGALRAACVAAGAAAADAADWHRLRVVAGWPEWGVDMDEGTLAQEANMDALQAISYRKGCYTGQETVARVHFRGHVNRTLRTVRYDAGALPAHGTPLHTSDGTAVGDARSSAVDFDGAGIGIAMVRRDAAESTLVWTDASGNARRAFVNPPVAETAP